MRETLRARLAAYGVAVLATGAMLLVRWPLFPVLGYRAPLPAAIMTISLMSLTGIPPLAGFFGKFYLFAAVLQVRTPMMTALALIGILNSAISLYYYARILKAMYFDKADSDAPVRTAAVHRWNMGLMAAGTLGLWVAWTPLVNAIETAVLAQWFPYVPILLHQ